MLLRVRVTLPDRPGALGQVARTLGVAGADIVQVVVLERLAGRAVDDFTVVWPGASRVERLLAGLGAIPGVQVDGVWRAIGAPTTGGQDAELLAQVAANPSEGLATLVDAVPGLLAADWAAGAVVPADWAPADGAVTAADRPARAGVPRTRCGCPRSRRCGRDRSTAPTAPGSRWRRSVAPGWCCSWPAPRATQSTSPTCRPPRSTSPRSTASRSSCAPPR